MMRPNFRPESPPLCAAALLAALLLMPLAGCDKIPTWNQLIGNEEMPAEPAQPVAQDPVVAEPQQPKPAPAEVKPEPKQPAMTPEIALAELQAGPLTSMPPDRFEKLMDALADEKGQVETLNLQNARFSADLLGRAAELPNLRSLSYMATPITDEAFAGVGDLEHLEVLNLNLTRLTSSGFDTLAKLTNLTELDLTGTDVTDEDLRHLQHMPKLEILRLNETRVNGQGLYDLYRKKKLPPLKHIEARKSQFGAYGFASQQGSETLEVLMAGDAGVSDGSMAALKNLRNLRHLDVSFNLLTNPSMGYLSGCRNLEKLQLRNTKRIDNKGLEQLKNCKKLKEIDLAGTGCNQGGINALKKSCPEVVGKF